MSLQKIGRYDITGELGKGAMGVVYKATDPNIGRTVAIKTTRLDAHGLDTEDLLRRFRNEARAAGTLNHPNIVTIYDAGEQEGVFYIAMEYIEGETLHGLLSQHRSLPLEKVIDIVRQVCAGLDYAHAHGVIHRDVKPANIMLAASGAVKVMDFGIAKAGGTVTATGQVLGTPNYMSPEQVKGKPIDGRSDLFSVGVLLYEMLTGEKPFDGQNVTTIIYKIVSENPIPPRELDVTIHPGLSAVVTKALAKAPDERYQTGAELVADLANYKSLGSESGATQLISAAGDRTVVTPAPPPTRPPAPLAPAPPSPTVQQASAPGMNMRVLVGVVVLLLIAALVAWRVYRRHQQQGQEAAATQSLPAVQQPAAAPPPAPPAETAATPTAPPQTPSAEATPAPEPPQPAPRPASKPKVKTAAVPPAPVPQPAPADAAGTGTVHVTSTPFGATVTIDGSGAFVTPFDSPPLKAGTHAFSVSKLGWSTVQRKLDVVAGKATNLDVSLAVSGAIVELQSDPPGAAILVDEKPTNKFTPARLAVPQGEHKIRLRMEGFKDENTVVTLAEGQTLSLSPKLAPAKGSKLKRLFKGGGGSPENMGTLEVTTHPDGAHITLNDAAAPETTPAKVAAKPGKYDLAIILPGYKTVHRAVEIEKGKTLGVDEVLEKEKP
ncbi:MAG: protein kinase domain-containing protein [Terriglobales bacterium]